jgi:hypothetical protein
VTCVPHIGALLRIETGVAINVDGAFNVDR